MNLIAACLAALSLSAPHGPADATGPEFASLVIRNDSGATVSYSIRWNRGTTVSYKIAPGGMRVHAVTAAGPQAAVVGWDADPRTGKINRVAQTFYPPRVKDRHQGLALRFQKIDGGHRIWLAP